MREGKNDKSDNIEMDILDEGDLDTARAVPENTLDGGETWNKIYEVIDNGSFKQSDVGFQK